MVVDKSQRYHTNCMRWFISPAGSRLMWGSRNHKYESHHGTYAINSERHAASLRSQPSYTTHRSFGLWRISSRSPGGICRYSGDRTRQRLGLYRSEPDRWRAADRRSAAAGFTLHRRRNVGRCLDRPHCWRGQRGDACPGRWPGKRAGKNVRASGRYSVIDHYRKRLLPLAGQR